MTAMECLVDAAQRACDAAVAAGAEFADAVAGTSESHGISLERGVIKSVDSRSHVYVSIRAYVRGGCGWAYASRLEPEDVTSAGEEAAALAAAADPDPDFIELPEGGPTQEIEGLFDDAVAGLSVDDLVALLMPEVGAAREVEPEAIIGGGAATGWARAALVSSRGVCVTRATTGLHCSINVVIRRGDDVGSFYDYDHARQMRDFAPQGIGRKAALEAKSFLGARQCPSGEMTVVFGPLAGSSALMPAIYAANAEDVQRKRSFMAGRKGEQVASPVVTMVDDPFIPGGASSSAEDGEGVPRRKLVIISNGVLTTYLHNSYTAGKGKEPNTAHSTRGGIAPTNCNPVPGAATAAQLIAEVDDGIYFNTGGVSVNTTTGDFSQVVDFGFKIEHGELTYPVQETMISGSYLEFLQNVDAISSDYREEPGAVMPTVRVSRVRVIGR